MRCFSRLAVVCAILLLTCQFIGTTRAADDPAPKPRVKLVMASAERVLEDLKWMIADLALEQKQWENNVFPSLDIFLFGVDRNKPIRFDALVGSGEEANIPGGYRLQPSIPVDRDGKDIRTFIRENLEPIGIDVKQKARGGYYQLSNVYDGWMRMVDEYACIGKFESDVPKGMPSPKESHDELLATGFDLAMEIDNQAEQSEERAKAFSTFAENMKDATKSREGESAAAFARRKGIVDRQLEKMQNLFVEARRITIGIVADVDNKLGRADLYGEGLPDTDLEKYIASIAVEPSRFAALEMPEDPAASLRVNLPFDEMWQRHLRETYELSRPVAHEKIAASEDITAEEKEPATKIADRLYDILTDSIEIAKLDMFVDMTANESGKHVVVFGIRAKDGKQADEIVRLIPQAHTAWKSEMDVDSIGDTSIHKLDISNDLPAALQDAFGDSGDVYVGTSPDVVWISGGDGSLELMKASIAKVADTPAPAEVSPVFGEFKVRAHTLLKLYDSLVVEMGWNPMGKIEVQPRGNRAGEGAGMQPIDPAEIREIATRATADIDDRVSGHASRIANHAEGEILVAPGLLRAIGKIVAKVAADNL